MKLLIKKEDLVFTPEKHLQMAGYATVRRDRNNEKNFVRRLGKGYYPRFHVYLKDKSESIELSLHLDQKKPSYSGVRAHNADHDGETLEEEYARVKSIILNSSNATI